MSVISATASHHLFAVVAVLLYRSCFDTFEACPLCMSLTRAKRAGKLLGSVAGKCGWEVQLGSAAGKCGWEELFWIRNGRPFGERAETANNFC